jgi:hypothetical protein
MRNSAQKHDSTQSQPKQGIQEHTSALATFKIDENAPK